jgi:DNA-binding SARP family transcriptional activator
MRLSLLGPVELVDDDGVVADIGSAKRRALLAVLGLELGQVVPSERLLEVLWDGEPPPQARTALHGHVSALRKLLGPGMRLVTRDPGYVLVAEPAGRSLPEGLAADLEEMRREALAEFASRLLGRGGEAVARLRAVVAADPLHEPLITAQVLCLNQSGRQADALGVYHAARRRLADELGIDPGL